MSYGDKPNAILTDEYTKSIVWSGVCDSIVHINGSLREDVDKHYDPEDIKWSDEQDDREYRRCSKEIDALSLLLIYDKLVLVAPDPKYVYDDLCSKYPIDVVSLDDEYEEISRLRQDKDAEGYKSLLRPWLIPSLAADLSRGRGGLVKTLCRAGWKYHEIADFLYGIFESEDPEKYFASKLGPNLFDQVLDVVIDSELSIRTRLAKQDMNWPWDYLGNLTLDISMEFGSLRHLIDLASSRDSVVLQKKYVPRASLSLGDFKRQDFFDNGLQESYACIKISCQSLLGDLPKLRSLDDVMELRENRLAEVLKLRHALSRIEFSARNGEVSRMEGAFKEASDAIRGLRNAQHASRVTEWATWLSIPVFCVEAMLRLPPVLSAAIGVAGTASQVSSKAAKISNSWVHVVR